MIGYAVVPSGDWRTLAGLAGALAASGLRLGGAVQVDAGAGCEAGMALHLLPSGERLPISAPPLPQGGCRLDAGALEQAVLRVVEALEAPADLVLLSKFGRQEAAGRGLRPAFARALESGAPIITTVTPEWAADFAAFSDGLAEAVAPRDLLAWAEAAAR